MELVFNTNKYLRKLASVWDLFGPPNSPARLLRAYDARFFGNPFYISAQIYDEMQKMAQSREGIRPLWFAFLDRNISTSKSDKRFTSLTKLVASLEIPMEDENGVLFRRFIKTFKGDFETYEKESAMLVGKIFGFTFPERLDVVLDLRGGVARSGSSLIADPPTIAMHLDKYERSCITLMLHELLHALVRKNKIIRSDKQTPRWLEDAVIEYFVPHAIIDEKLGFIDSFNIDEFEKEREFARPYAAEEFRRLLPHIKEYYKICGKKTIWRFLEEKGFDTFRTNSS